MRRYKVPEKEHPEIDQILHSSVALPIRADSADTPCNNITLFAQPALSWIQIAAEPPLLANKRRLGSKKSKTGCLICRLARRMLLLKSQVHYQDLASQVRQIKAALLKMNKHRPSM
jgi:hypothetical protein